MALGQVSSALKAARLGSKKKKEDDPAYELHQEGERLAAAEQSKAQNLKDRQKLASNLKDFSGRGALSQEMLGQAKEQAKELGIGEDQMSSFLKDNRIKSSTFESVTPQESPFGPSTKTAEAAAPSEQPTEQKETGLKGMEGLDARQKLAYAQEFGSPMEQYKALEAARAQDKAEGKPFQSYSRIGESRSITSESKKAMNRLGKIARNFQRLGIPMAALGQVAGAIAAQGVGESSLTSKKTRQQAANRRIALDEQAQQRRDMFSEFLKSLRNKNKLDAAAIQQPKIVQTPMAKPKLS